MTLGKQSLSIRIAIETTGKRDDYSSNFLPRLKNGDRLSNMINSHESSTH